MPTFCRRFEKSALAGNSEDKYLHIICEVMHKLLLKTNVPLTFKNMINFELNKFYLPSLHPYKVLSHDPPQC